VADASRRIQVVATDADELTRLRAELHLARAALHQLLEPYSRFSNADLRQAVATQRVPAGLGKHRPIEVLAARAAAGMKVQR